MALQPPVCNLVGALLHNALLGVARPERVLVFLRQEEGCLVTVTWASLRPSRWLSVERDKALIEGISKQRGGKPMRGIVVIVAVLGLMGLRGIDQSGAVEVSSGHAGDALIFPLWEVNNLDTLIAIESFVRLTALYRVRFRDETGNNALEFTLCLPPFSTWAAAIFRDGSVTRVQSSSTLLVNGSPTPLNETLAGNPTRGYIEVIGLRGDAPILAPENLVCTNPDTPAGDVFKSAVMGRAYYVNVVQSSILAYGANAVALKDFATDKITDGTVLGNSEVASAMTFHEGTLSTRVGSRYFVDPSFGAITQVVMTFPTGPTSASCPLCRVPSGLAFIPFRESGEDLSTSVSTGPPGGMNLPFFNRSTDGKLVNVFTVTSSDIASNSGVLEIADSPPFFLSMAATGFVVQTTTSTSGPIFAVLFPLTIP